LRLYCGSKGNKTETSQTIFFFLVLILPCLIGNIYYIILQTYALVIEVILGIIIIICMILELFIALFAAIDFKSLEKA
jgi:membrane protein YdbS with pleckstrin-like domain